MRYLFFLFVSINAIAQVPAYYQSIDFNQSSENLKQQLNTLISNTHTFSLEYTSFFGNDTWDALYTTDLQINSTTDVMLIYGYNDTDTSTNNDRTRNKNLSCHTNSCTGLWNREHIYARSYANPNMDTDLPGIATDLHNLRACDSQLNSSRSNRKFENSTGVPSQVLGSDAFYPGEEWKGDVARTIMYMYVRYADEAIANRASNSSHTYHPDMPDVFLIWNVEDPVSDFEIQRNNRIQTYQGNRNPFIDNPYLATLIWGGPEAVDNWNLSVEDLYSQGTKLIIYPNPTADFLQISLPFHQAEIITYNGQIKNTSTTNPINVAGLESGIYLVKLHFENGTVQSLPFIKK